MQIYGQLFYFFLHSTPIFLLSALFISRFRTSALQAEGLVILTEYSEIPIFLIVSFSSGNNRT